MSKLTDFYKKAATDPALKADLEAAQKRYEGQNPDKATFVAEGIAIAAKHGVTLEATDFELAEGELDEEELSAVAGGCDLHQKWSWVPFYNIYLIAACPDFQEKLRQAGQ
ncbi:hypothetical protein AGMMS49928_23430 [Spirochaetia bacterium]|nr:hypothetical protein AGMMS49928_23430 [Spirochaetia bacterium]